MFPHTINIYSGGSYNEIHDCENVYLSCEKAEVHVDKNPVVSEAQKEPSRLPEELLTDAARILHAKLCDAGMVDADRLYSLSRQIRSSMTNLLQLCFVL